MTCKIPAEIKSGLTLDLDADYQGYDAGGNWVITAYFRGPSSFQIESVNISGKNRLRATAAVTSGWQPGHYAYTIRASNSLTDDVHELASGNVKILVDLALVVEGGDYRSHALRTLEAIEAVIENRASLDQERYRIKDRELYRTPIADLLKLRGYYQNLVNKERAKACGKSLFGQTIKIGLK